MRAAASWLCTRWWEVTCSASSGLVMGSSHMKQTADIVICNFSKNGTILWNYVDCLFIDIKEF